MGWFKIMLWYSPYGWPWKVQAKPVCMAEEGAQGAAPRFARHARIPRRSGIAGGAKDESWLLPAVTE